MEGAQKATQRAERGLEEARRQLEEAEGRERRVDEGEAGLRLRGRELEELTLSLQDQQARLVR